MKTWKQIKEEYAPYLKARLLKQPKRRLTALGKIEGYLQTTHPSVFKGYAMLAATSKNDLKEKYTNWKGRNISGAESQVINDLYKLAQNKDISY
jgi:hypothetical protein